MHILREGTCFTSTLTCVRCDAEFSYRPIDLEEDKVTDDLFLTCPNCRNKLVTVVSETWKEVRRDMLDYEAKKEAMRVVL